MKILIITTSYPTKDNPARGIFLKKIVNNLIKNGIFVDVLNLEKYKALTVGAGILPNLKKSWKARLQFPVYLIHLYFSIIKRASKCDVIHANWGLTAFLALLAKPFHRKKIILSERSSQLIYTNSKLLKLILKLVYNNVNKMVVISGNSMDSVSNIYGVPNISVIPNGVEFKDKMLKFNTNKIKNALHLRKDSRIILFVGRLTSVKSVSYLIEGFNLAKIKNKILIIVGTGEEELKLKELALKLGIDKNILFIGQVNPEQTGKYFSIADVFVLPSIMETGGNVLLEALTFDVPIISTNVGWAQDFIINNQNGYIINKRDSLDIKNKLELLLNDKKNYLRIKKNVNHTVKTKLISWEKCAKLYIEQYKLLNK